MPSLKKYVSKFFEGPSIQNIGIKFSKIKNKNKFRNSLSNNEKAWLNKQINRSFAPYIIVKGSHRFFPKNNSGSGKRTPAQIQRSVARRLNNMNSANSQAALRIMLQN